MFWFCSEELLHAVISSRISLKQMSQLSVLVPFLCHPSDPFKILSVTWKLLNSCPQCIFVVLICPKPERLNCLVCFACACAYVFRSKGFLVFGWSSNNLFSWFSCWFLRGTLSTLKHLFEKLSWKKVVTNKSNHVS